MNFPRHRHSPIPELLLVAVQFASTACGGGTASSDAGVPTGAVDSAATGERDSAGSSAGDSGRSTQASDSGSMPEGRVSVFVAAGAGGRRIISCDSGRTWIGDFQIADESEDDLHRPYTPKGIAYGDGTFVIMTGWGGNSSVLFSQDGVDWTTVPLENAYAGVGYDGRRFVALGNYVVGESVNRGQTWNLIDRPFLEFTREVTATDGVWAAGSDGEVLLLRERDTDWHPLESCTGVRHESIGQDGGFAMGMGLLLSVGTAGDTCVYDVENDRDLGAGTIGDVGYLVGRPTFVGDAFMLANDGHLYRSDDGLHWTTRDLPSGVDFTLLAREPSGTYVGVSADGDRFYYSDDGESWTRATAPEGNGLSRIIVGWGAASAQCPQR